MSTDADPSARPPAAGGADDGTAGEAVVVTTSRGAVRGRWRGTPGTPGASAAFRGIPYAQAPVGPLRFAAPVPPEPWDGVLDATAYGPTPQRGDTGPTLIPEPSVPGDATLSVNVVTPRPGGTPDLPVLVYVHGGGFVGGSPASPWYDGAAFARDGVVTVTLSYRLGVEGFGHVPDAPENRGVRDWLAALAWVRDEVAAFGGDPGRVTLAGQSAGGGAVLTLLASPAARGLFHRALAVSPALGDVPLASARARSRRVAALAGVAPTRAGFESVPEDRLHAAQERSAAADGPVGAFTALAAEGMPWGPVVDGDLVPVPTVEALAGGAGADVPLVLGSADDEFTMALDAVRRRLRLVPPGLALRRLGVDAATRRAYLAANQAQRRRGTAAVLGRYVSDVVFRSLVARVAGARTAHGRSVPTTAPTWVYRFAWVSPTRGWALHCLDVPFWFDLLDAPGVTDLAGAVPPQALADAVHGAAVAFVHDGDPGWRAWSQEPGRTRVLDVVPAPGAADDGTVADGYASVAALV